MSLMNILYSQCDIKKFMKKSTVNDKKQNVIFPKTSSLIEQHDLNVVLMVCHRRSNSTATFRAMVQSPSVIAWSAQPIMFTLGKANKEARDGEEQIKQQYKEENFTEFDNASYPAKAKHLKGVRDSHYNDETESLFKTTLMSWATKLDNVISSDIEKGVKEGNKGKTLIIKSMAENASYVMNYMPTFYSMMDKVVFVTKNPHHKLVSLNSKNIFPKELFPQIDKTSDKWTGIVTGYFDRSYSGYDNVMKNLGKVFPKLAMEQNLAVVESSFLRMNPEGALSELSNKIGGNGVLEFDQNMVNNWSKTLGVNNMHYNGVDNWHFRDKSEHEPNGYISSTLTSTGFVPPNKPTPMLESRFGDKILEKYLPEYFKAISDKNVIKPKTIAELVEIGAKETEQGKTYESLHPVTFYAIATGIAPKGKEEIVGKKGYIERLEKEYPEYTDSFKAINNEHTKLNFRE